MPAKVSLTMNCVYYRPGRVAYEEALALQERFWREKIAGKKDDFLLLLSHPPTFTLGKTGSLTNLLIGTEGLSRLGLPLYPADRGGDITYLGPGQLVAYPVMDLKRRNQDIPQFVHNLEEAVIGTLGDFSLRGSRIKDHPGVWIEGEKICAVGLSIRRWISRHGLALNVTTDLSCFSLINPCGIAGGKVTSLKAILRRDIPLAEVEESFLSHFARVFSLTLIPGVLKRAEDLPERDDP